MRGIARYLSLVKFSHSIFALPFALQAAWLAAGGLPSAWQSIWILVALVAARTAAMAFNRLADRELDRANPRTAGRELPSGVVSVLEARVVVLLSAAVFIGAAWALGPLPGRLALPVLAVLLGYSYVKRVSAAAHLVLGLALALAPLGAWVAIRGVIDAAILPILALAGAVWAWVSGFDLIYACQDADHDRAVGLHSIPARLGVARALSLARLLHILAVALLATFTLLAGLGWIYGGSVAAVAVLLVWEHRLVSPEDLSRVDMAFFTLNGWVSVALLVGLLFDRRILGG